MVGDTNREALDRGPTLINPIIYAEISIGFERIEELEGALPSDIVREALPWDAAFLAGTCYVEYRRRGGSGVRRSQTSTSGPTPR